MKAPLFDTCLFLFLILLISASVSAEESAETDFFQLRVDSVTVNGQVVDTSLHLTPSPAPAGHARLKRVRVTGYAADPGVKNAESHAMNDAWYRLALNLGQISQTTRTETHRQTAITRTATIMHHTCIVRLPADIRYHMVHTPAPLLAVDLSLLAGPALFPDASFFSRACATIRQHAAHLTPFLR
ncbi:MAG: hypothetical protein CSA22_04135 [Deltaproteobacteria bacterium]|nr:MAG: hypothetical protein CSA22_04135 [Deltaproteobacteria bacterium]